MAEAATLVPASTREQLAEQVKELLTDEPKSAAQLGRENGRKGRASTGPDRGMQAALAVLEARGEARRVGRNQWVAISSPLEARIVEAQHHKLPFRPEVVPFDQMFIDKEYQRPLSTFAEKVEREFDPFLMQVLVLSDRGQRSRPKRFAIIDGQTRWHGAGKRGVQEWLCIVFSDLTQAQEAELFARFQKERRGVTSWYRFRAQLKYDPESQAIAELVRGCGYEIGDRAGQLSSIGALESCYRRDDLVLFRTLTTLRATWDPPVEPPAIVIKGLHYFYLNPRQQFRAKSIEIDDERMVRRLKMAGVEQLRRRASAAREFGAQADGASSLSGHIWMAKAIAELYKSGGR